VTLDERQRSSRRVTSRTFHRDARSFPGLPRAALAQRTNGTPKRSRYMGAPTFTAGFDVSLSRLAVVLLLKSLRAAVPRQNLLRARWTLTMTAVLAKKKYPRHLSPTSINLLNFLVCVLKMCRITSSEPIYQPGGLCDVDDESNGPAATRRGRAIEAR
jgi:hypothetical protein